MSSGALGELKMDFAEEIEGEEESWNSLQGSMDRIVQRGELDK